MGKSIWDLLTAVGQAFVTVAIALGLTLAIVVGGLAGAGLSLLGLGSADTGRSRIYNVLAGITIAYFCTPAVMLFLELKPGAAGGVAFVLGLFGVSLLREIFEWLRGGGARRVVESFANKFLSVREKPNE